MSSVADKTVIRTRVAPLVVRFVDWPLRDDPLRSTVLIAGIVGLSATAGVVVGNLGMAIVVFLVLGLLVWKLWIPTTYELSSKGVILRWLGRRRRIAWSEFSRYDVSPEGVVLSPEAQPTGLGQLRSLFLRWNDRPDELIALLEAYLPTQPVSTSGSTQSYPRAS